MLRHTLPLTALAALFVVLTACNLTRNPNALEWPSELPGGYSLQSSSTEPPTTAPDDVKSLGVRRVHTATYSGDAEVTVTAYEMTSTAGVLELLQQWRNSAGSIALEQGSYFIVLKSAEASIETLNPIGSAVQSWLASAR